MGGGASHGSLEGLLASTLMVGRAIASIYRNPGMYRLHDFHSALAPKLKSNNAQNPFVFFGQESDEEDDIRPEVRAWLCVRCTCSVSVSVRHVFELA